jgi:hypothetical protein
MITSAIALNEVVNAPDSYVSRTPHLVISQVCLFSHPFGGLKRNTERKLAGLDSDSVSLRPL